MKSELWKERGGLPLFGDCCSVGLVFAPFGARDVVGHVAGLLISGSIDFLWPRPDSRLSVINKDFQVVSRLLGPPFIAFFYGQAGDTQRRAQLRASSSEELPRTESTTTARRGRQITDFNNVAQVA